MREVFIKGWNKSSKRRLISVVRKKGVRLMNFPAKLQQKSRGNNFSVIKH